MSAPDEPLAPELDSVKIRELTLAAADAAMNVVPSRCLWSH